MCALGPDWIEKLAVSDPKIWPGPYCISPDFAKKFDKFLVVYFIRHSFFQLFEGPSRSVGKGSEESSAKVP